MLAQIGQGVVCEQASLTAKGTHWSTEASHTRVSLCGMSLQSWSADRWKADRVEVGARTP